MRFNFEIKVYLEDVLSTDFRQKSMNQTVEETPLKDNDMGSFMLCSREKIFQIDWGSISSGPRLGF